MFDISAFSFASSGRDFDPRTRAFSDEELKPQPMIKKSRKQFVPDELKDDKYWARRRKNNIAAKRSRDARRQKENQIAMRARYLEKEVSYDKIMYWNDKIILSCHQVQINEEATKGLKNSAPIHFNSSILLDHIGISFHSCCL